MLTLLVGLFLKIPRIVGKSLPEPVGVLSMLPKHSKCNINYSNVYPICRFRRDCFSNIFGLSRIWIATSYTKLGWTTSTGNRSHGCTMDTDLCCVGYDPRFNYGDIFWRSNSLQRKLYLKRLVVGGFELWPSGAHGGGIRTWLPGPGFQDLDPRTWTTPGPGKIPRRRGFQDLESSRVHVGGNCVNPDSLMISYK